MSQQLQKTFSRGLNQILIVLILFISMISCYNEDIEDYTSLLSSFNVKDVPFYFSHLNHSLHHDLDSNNNNDGGIYGFWKYDEFDLPYFEYIMDELTNPKAEWPNTEQIPPLNVTRTDHFYLFGNSRINVKAVNDGYMELFGSDRGPMWSNYYEPEYNNIAGGFSYLNIRDNLNNNNIEDVYSTAYLYGPHNDNTQWKREFHIGTYTSELKTNNILFTRSTTAPYGDYSFVIDEIEITNIGNTIIENMDHYEFWDINYWQLEIEWFRTGYFAEEGDIRRHDLNRKFNQFISYDNNLGYLRSSMISNESSPPVTEDEPSEINYYPLDIFLYNFDGNINDIYWNQTRFFGSGNFSFPEVVTNNLNGDSSNSNTINGKDQQFMMSMKSSFSNIQPNQTITLKFAYGYIPSNESITDLLEPFINLPSKVSVLNAIKWKNQTANVKLGDSDNCNSNSFLDCNNIKSIEREIIWRSGQFQSSSLYHEYFNNHVLPQGSEYLYLSGADGAPRDLLLSLAGNVLLNPILSKETLNLVMETQDSKTGGMWYAIGGYGKVSSALGLHKFPSDLDIFLFFGFNEYISATGDIDYITNVNIPFYPKSSTNLPPGAQSNTVLDHIRVAYYHLKNNIGIGNHGLIRILQGDWDDGVVYSDPDPLAIYFSIKHGESIPNTQMALYCLPITAKIIEPFDNELAQDMLEFASNLTEPTKKSFGSKWFGRAWLRDRLDVPYLRGNDHLTSNSSESYIDLESQPWGLLIDNLLTLNQKESIYENIENYLDKPSPIGPLQSPNGYVWPAISQLLPWVYSKNDKIEKAWNIFNEHLYSTHGNYFPDVWMGIWSGPDGWIAYLPESGFEIHGYEGGTWYSLFTPMTDFPVSNSNPDAMFCLSLERLLGIEPSLDGDGLFINATRAGLNFNMNYPVLNINSIDNGIYGEYRSFINNGNINLSIAIPNNISNDNIICEIQNYPYNCIINDNNQVKLPIGPFNINDIISFSILW